MQQEPRIEQQSFTVSRSHNMSNKPRTGLCLEAGSRNLDTIKTINWIPRFLYVKILLPPSLSVSAYLLSVSFLVFSFSCYFYVSCYFSFSCYFSYYCSFSFSCLFLSLVLFIFIVMCLFLVLFSPSFSCCSSSSFYPSSFWLLTSSFFLLLLGLRCLCLLLCHHHLRSGHPSQVYQHSHVRDRFIGWLYDVLRLKLFASVIESPLARD